MRRRRTKPTMLHSGNQRATPSCPDPTARRTFGTSASQRLCPHGLLGVTERRGTGAACHSHTGGSASEPHIRRTKCRRDATTRIRLEPASRRNRVSCIAHRRHITLVWLHMPYQHAEPTDPYGHPDTGTNRGRHLIGGEHATGCNLIYRHNRGCGTDHRAGTHIGGLRATIFVLPGIAHVRFGIAS